MGGQVYIAKPTAEEIARQREKEAEERASYRALQLYGHVSNGGNSSGHGFNWASMPRLSIWR